jgi:S1-C subfamily serine protease
VRHLHATLGLIVALIAPAPAAALSPQEIVQKASPSVAHLSIRDASGEEESSGSGFVITEDGWIVTNFHVVDGAEHMVAVFPGNREVEIVGSRLFDEHNDLAVLQLKAGRYPAIPLAKTAARQGDEIVVIGSPLGLGSSVSTGIVSAVRENGTVTRTDQDGEESWGLQITAGIAPGSSGSPILNSHGEVVGIAVGEYEGSPLYFGVLVDRLHWLLKHGGAEVRSLKAVHKGDDVLRNLLVSFGIFTIAALVWWWMTIRARGQAPRPSGWRAAR